MATHAEPFGFQSATGRRGVHVGSGKRLPVSSRTSQWAAAGGAQSSPDLATWFGAATSGDVGTLRRLVTNGVDVGLEDAAGRNALHLAASAGKLLAVEVLVQERVALNARDRLGMTPLMKAAQNRHLEVVDYLRRAGAEVPTAEDSRGSGERVARLAAEGELEELRNLAVLDHGALGVLEGGKTLLHLASGAGHLEVVEFLLLELPTLVNARDREGKTALDYAEALGREDVVQKILEFGGVRAQDESAVLNFRLCNAAHKGDVKEIEALIRQGADINGFDYDYRVPLHLAAAGGHLEAVRFLIEKGASRDMEDRWGSDPYQEAIRYGHLEVAALLDSNGDFSFKIYSCLDEFEDEFHTGDEQVGKESDEFAESNLHPELSKDDSTFRSASCCSRFGRMKPAFHSALKSALETCKSLRNGCVLVEFWTAPPHRAQMECCHIITDFASQNIQNYRSVSKHLPVEFMLFFSGRVFRSKNPTQLSNLSKIRQAKFPLSPAAANVGIESCMAIPLRISITNESVGAFVFYYESPTPPAVPQDEVSQLCWVVDILALDALYLKEKVSREDYSDSLRRLTTVGPKEQNADAKDSNEIRGQADANDMFLITELNEVQLSKIGHPTNTEELIFVISILSSTGALQRALRWSQSMESEDHKSSLSILIALSHILLHLSPSLQSKILHDLDYELSLKFLSTVSPLERIQSPVREEINECITRLRSQGLFSSEPPYFGRGLPSSPVVSQLAELKMQLFRTLLDFTQLEDLENMRTKDLNVDLLEFSPRLVFQTFGQSKVQKNTPGKKDEHSRISEFASELLRRARSDPILTVANIKSCHALLDLDSHICPGEFRSELVVGSHMYYRFYRCFAPHEEVETAMEQLEHEINVEAVQNHWNGIQKAFYAFASIVMFIHPFEDGNGRLGRLFANLLLLAEGYTPVFQYVHKVITFGEVLELVWDKLNLQREMLRRL